MIRSTTSLNASVTPTAVFADASTNKHPVRAAKAAPSAVGTWREYSCGQYKRVGEMELVQQRMNTRAGWSSSVCKSSSTYFVQLIPDDDLYDFWCDVGVEFA
jgi:hypothetical protein